jgi:hypothetical protein
MENNASIRTKARSFSDSRRFTPMDRVITRAAKSAMARTECKAVGTSFRIMSQAALHFNREFMAVARAFQNRGGLPQDAEELGLKYFLEVFIARDFVEDWAASLEDGPRARAVLIQNTP